MRLLPQVGQIVILTVAIAVSYMDLFEETRK